MENTNIALAANIQRYRKKTGLTQEELANKIGVTFQAVSKWENAKAAPDIMLLPLMADLFGCYIDELFSRGIKSERLSDCDGTLPWRDDGIIRGVVYEGRRMLKAEDGIGARFTFEIIGDAKHVQSECNISVSGSVSEGCGAIGSIEIGGSLTGGCGCAGCMNVGGNISGDISCGGGMNIGGGIVGKINCGECMDVSGDVRSDSITGNIICNHLECNHIQGEVIINKDN